MVTREIPRGEWPDFFSSFSQIHEGWLCTVEVLDPTFGAQVQATDVHFMSLTGDVDEDASVAISLGDEPDRHLNHIVPAPEHIWLEQTDRGADEALAIDSGDTRTLLRFRSTALPEEVDGA
jgi:hypothetical protein